MTHWPCDMSRSWLVSLLPAAKHVCVHSKCFACLTAVSNAGAARGATQALCADSFPLGSWLMHNVLAEAVSIQRAAAVKLLHVLLLPQQDPEASAADQSLATAASAAATTMPPPAVAAPVPATDGDALATAGGDPPPASDVSAANNASVMAPDAVSSKRSHTLPPATGTQASNDAFASEATLQAPSSPDSPDEQCVAPPQLQLLQRLLSTVAEVLQPAAASRTPNSAFQIQADQSTSSGSHAVHAEPALAQTPEAAATPPFESVTGQPSASDGAGQENHAVHAGPHGYAGQEGHAVHASSAGIVDGDALHAVLGLLLRAAGQAGFRGMAALFTFPSKLVALLPQLLATTQVDAADRPPCLLSIHLPVGLNFVLWFHTCIMQHSA